jgi:hypothetical protein
MSDTIFTLQDFMFHTKGIIYLLAIGYLIGFTWFWKFLRNDKPKKDID